MIGIVISSEFVGKCALLAMNQAYGESGNPHPEKNNYPALQEVRAFFTKLVNHDLPLLCRAGPEYMIPTSFKLYDEYNNPKYLGTADKKDEKGNNGRHFLRGQWSAAKFKSYCSLIGEKWP